MMQQLRKVVALTLMEIAAGLIVSLIVIAAASLSVKTFSFVYQGF